MLSQTKTRVLIPEKIIKQRSSLTELNFFTLVRKYLTRYPNYELIRVEKAFAICNRMDEKPKRRKRS